jgi:hypothetical protein
MSTNNVHSCYLFDSKQQFQEHEVLKEYRPYEGCQIKMLFDSFEGVTATILDEEGKQEVITFDRINGVPSYLRFNAKKLLDYLADTYITVRAYDDGSRKLCVNLKMRGGGNSFSSHSSHAQSFTPPRFIIKPLVIVGRLKYKKLKPTLRDRMEHYLMLQGE